MRKTGSVSKALDSSRSAPGSNDTVRSVVDELAGTLERGGRDDPLSSARDIVAALLHVSRYWSALAGDVLLQAQVAEAARGAAQRGAAGDQIAYAVGRAQCRQRTTAAR